MLRPLFLLLFVAMALPESLTQAEPAIPATAGPAFAPTVAVPPVTSSAAAADPVPNPPPLSHTPPALSLHPMGIPRPFGRGGLELGVVLGISAGQQTSVTLGGGFGYFVLPGLEPGLVVDVTFGSDQPTVTSLMPYLRGFLWRSYAVSPYVKVQGGRWFISGQSDLTPLAVGGGLVFFLSGQLGVQLEGMAIWLFPLEACPGNSCFSSSIGLSLGFYFGGGNRIPPARVPEVH